MANLQNRTRVLYVRVSDQEFQQLKDLCQKHGARNMSDLVRTSMECMSRTHPSNFEAEITHRLRQLELAVHDLKTTVTQINAERTC